MGTGGCSWCVDSAGGSWPAGVGGAFLFGVPVLSWVGSGSSANTGDDPSRRTATRVEGAKRIKLLLLRAGVAADPEFSKRRTSTDYIETPIDRVSSVRLRD